MLGTMFNEGSKSRRDDMTGYRGPSTSRPLAANSAAKRQRRGLSAQDDANRFLGAALVITSVKHLLFYLCVTVLAASCVLAQNRTAPVPPASKWTDAQKAEMAERVRQDFLHAWGGYKQYAWGHDELQPLTKSYRDWYAPAKDAKGPAAGEPGSNVAADDAGRCARHHGPDGPEGRSR